MKNLLLTTILVGLVLTSFAQDPTTFILVRHSEKANDGTRNPPLNEKGLKRSDDLAKLLANQEINALYSTPFKRTQETLQPIVETSSLEIKSYDPASKGEWLDKVIERHKGGTVVIAGHSNTIPFLANELLGTDGFSQFDDTDYSNLIIIVAEKVGNGKLVWLQF